DRGEACARVCLHRRDRLRIHHGAERHGLRDRLCLHQFRQRDDVSPHCSDIAVFHHSERRADALGESAARSTRPALMDEGRKPLRNTVVLIVGLLGFWQLMYFVVGDVAMRSPWQTLRSTVALGRNELFWLDVENTMLAFA